MVQTLFEKFFFKEEKNILVQGLPASIERNFMKIKFSKNVTPLLKTKKIDFALLFAINRIQLERIAPEVIDAMSEHGKLWVAFPKNTSKIFSDLTQNEGWNILSKNNYIMVRLIAIDHVWAGVRFEKKNNLKERLFKEEIESEFIFYDKRTVEYPEDLKTLFEQFVEAQLFFDSIIFEFQKDIILWLELSNSLEERAQRLKIILEKLLIGEFIIT